MSDYSFLKYFSCLCFATNSTSHKTKFEKIVSQGVFIGYTPGFKAYKLYELNYHKVLISRYVISYENDFPYQNIPNIQPTCPLPVIDITVDEIYPNTLEGTPIVVDSSYDYHYVNHHSQTHNSNTNIPNSESPINMSLSYTNIQNTGSHFLANNVVFQNQSIDS